MKRSTSNNILMLVENNPYPQDTRVRQEAQSLARAGYRVTVIAPRAAGQPWREQLAGVQAYRYPAPPPGQGVAGFVWEYAYSLAMAWVLTLWVYLRHGFAVIHAHNPPDLFVLIAVPYKLLGVRFVYDHHDLWTEMYRIRFCNRRWSWMLKLVALFEWLSCRAADHIIATNQSYKELEMMRAGVSATTISIVRNGPDLQYFRPLAPDAELCETGKCIIGYVGLIGDHDGLDYLVRACRHLTYDLRRHDFLCVVVGDGDQIPALKVLAAELDVSEYIRFAGYRRGDELLRYLSAMDICVAVDPKNDYNDRSTMIKIMEYMALSKPIVAFDLTEHRRSAQDAAVYVAGDDELELAHQIAALIDDPERRQRLGAVGRRRVEAELAWEHQERQLLAAYRTICPPQDKRSAQRSITTEIQL